MALAPAVVPVPVAGAGRIELSRSVREGARSLEFIEDDTALRAVHMRVIRRFTVPDLEPGPHEYPDSDPVAELPPPAHPGEIQDPVPGEVTAPGGEVSAVPIKYGRLFGLLLLRTADRSVMRFIGGAACGAWNSFA